MIDNERIKRMAVPAAIGIVFTLLVLVIMTVSAGYDVLVKEKSGFYRARSLFIAGNAIICFRDPEFHATKREALDTTEENWSLYVSSMKDVQAIEFYQADDDSDPALGEWKATLRDYVGDYQINAAGNRGFLSLRAGGGRVYGTVRFTDWGRGATEYLKSLQIGGGKIYFIRSVTTAQELKRVGGNAYFVQRYSGEYIKSGRMIKGFYTVYGSRKEWEAIKTSR